MGSDEDVDEVVIKVVGTTGVLIVETRREGLAHMGSCWTVCMV